MSSSSDAGVSTSPRDAAAPDSSSDARTMPGTRDAHVSTLDAGDAGAASDAGAATAPDAAASMPWLAYNYSPSGRTIAPATLAVHGNVTGSNPGVLSGQPTRLNGANSGVTFDFGREVGGIVSLKFGATSDSAQSVSLAFTESSQYIGPTSDQSIGPPTQVDGALAVTAAPNGTYVMPTNKLRGGFRYLSVYLSTGGWVELTGVSLSFTAAPTMPVPNHYSNYFYSNDDLLNRIWYAGAYTVQLATIDPKQGRAFPYPAPGTNWNNGATVGVGASVLVDGAKRDRTVWAGDLGIAFPTAYVSTDDLVTMKNSIDTLFAGQDPSTGELPRSGPPLNPQNSHTTSDTYHLWTLIGASNYYLFSGDKAWLDTNWAAFKKAVAFSTAKIGSNGLFQVTLVKDWGRLGQTGANIAANAILYRVLVSAIDLATVEGDTATATAYKTQAAGLKTSANALLWDATTGSYRDNPTSTVHPQDGNSLAIWFGLVDTVAKAQSITTALRKNWNSFGSQTPEGDPTRATISPFPGSMEVAARFVAGDDQGGLDLIRLEWGYMLGASIGTGSTFWEGYLADGTFGYGGSYMSAAHGWSTGPTFALTEWVLGVAPDSAAGQTYHVIPHAGDLTHAEGMLTMAPGKVVRVSYDHPACGDFSLHVDASTHVGSVGVIGIPKFGQSRVVQRNGVTIWNGTAVVASPGITSADEDANYIYIRGVAPSQAVFAFYPKQCP
jgi:alpha-L-rhamnosidase-like protein